MKVEIVERETAHDKLIADPALQELVGEVAGQPKMAGLAASILVNYKTLAAVQDGVGVSDKLKNFAPQFLPDRSVRATVTRSVELVEDLYTRFDPAHVRGVVLEQIIEHRLRRRYVSKADTLANNARFKVVNGTTFETKNKDVDVIGFDPRAQKGEVHACKIKSGEFKSEKTFLDKLSRELPPRGIHVGLVVAEGRHPAEKRLARDGVNIRTARCIGFEDWYKLAPLQGLWATP